MTNTTITAADTAARLEQLADEAARVENDLQDAAHTLKQLTSPQARKAAADADLEAAVAADASGKAPKKPNANADQLAAKTARAQRAVDVLTEHHRRARADYLAAQREADASGILIEPSRARADEAQAAYLAAITALLTARQHYTDAVRDLDQALQARMETAYRDASTGAVPPWRLEPTGCDTTFGELDHPTTSARIMAADLEPCLRDDADRHTAAITDQQAAERGRERNPRVRAEAGAAAYGDAPRAEADQAGVPG